MNYRDGTVFYRIGQANARLAWVIMMAREADGLEKCSLGESQTYAEARTYLKSILIEGDSSQQRKDWFEKVNQYIAEINSMRAEMQRPRVESMQNMLRRLTDQDWVRDVVTWDELQRLCGELTSVVNIIERRIREDAQEATKPFVALLR